ncbi:MAG TPA: hypothetical protein VKK31_11620 [Thermoanaerobaculia bacterium]|nr:hypothetical protein [Thermoanaerobaculia bacterium]
MVRKATALIDEITHYVKQGLEEKLSAYSAAGQSFDGIGPAREVAQRMLQIVPLPSRWDEFLGPFYGTSQVAKILGGVSRQAIADRRERRTLLGLKTADGVVVYPTFQFDERNRVLTGLAEVLQVFHDGAVDDWTLAGLLVSPMTSLQGQSLIQWLRAGGEIEPALALARDAARRFAA